MMVHMHPATQCVFSSFPVCVSLVVYLLALTAGEDGLSGSQPISDLHAYAFNKLIFHNPKKKEKLAFVTPCVSRPHSTG